MKKVMITKFDPRLADSIINTSSWDIYVSEGPIIERNIYDVYEAVYVEEGTATVKALGCVFNLNPGCLITFSAGVEYIWIVENYSRVRYTHCEQHI